MVLPYPHPRAAIFDNGPKFSNELLELLNSYGVIAKPTTIKNLQTNAFVKRIHQDIGDSIQNVAHGLQGTYHSSLAASPGQIIFGHDMIINGVYLANWKGFQPRRQKDLQ
jgi:hypothetical protein